MTKSATMTKQPVRIARVSRNQQKITIPYTIDSTAIGTRICCRGTTMTEYGMQSGSVQDIVNEMNEDNDLVLYK